MIIYIFLINLLLTDNLAQDIAACGGTVKSSITNFNFQKLSVKLFLSDGSLNYESEILPNGAFSVPIYDLADYILKIEGPKGWSFQPDNGYKIHSNEKFTCQNDYNFQFNGFTIYGKISTANIDMGPSGIDINLYAKGSLIKSTKSVNGGEFEIKNVLPGDYSLMIMLDTFRDLSHESNIAQELKVSNDNVIIKDSFIIQGFPVYGNVLFDNTNMLGVDIFVFSKSKLDNNKYRCTKFTESEMKLENAFPFCMTKTNEKGNFNFPIMPGGKYVVIAKYLSKASKFEIIPTSHNFEVTSQPVNLNGIFHIIGFSVNGKVVDLNNAPITKAKIFVNDQDKGLVKSDGTFEINQVKRSSNIISISADGFVFEKTSVNFDPNKSFLGEFKPTKVAICGSIFVDLTQNSEKSPDQIFRNLKISLTQEATGQKIDTVGVTVSDNSIDRKEDSLIGEFCFYAVPGNYIVSPEFNQMKSILSLAPAKIKVELVTRPVYVKFSQFRGKIFGSISCLELCKTGEFEVTLKSVDESFAPVHFTQHISVDPNNGSRGLFSFPNIDPGWYQFELVSANNMLSVTSRYCWSTTKHLDQLIDRDLHLATIFQQTGYALPIVSSHSITVLYYYLNNVKQSNNSSDKVEPQLVDQLQLSPGSSTICLNKSGKYEFVGQTCFKLQHERISVDTNNICSGSGSNVALTDNMECSVKFIVERFLISVDFRLNNQPISDKLLNEVVSVVINYQDADKLIVQPLSWDQSTFTMKYWAKASTAMTILINSTKYLVQPLSIEFSLDSNSQSCETVVGTFYLESGTFITGQIDPVMSDVEVTITQIPEEETTAIQSITDEKGQFSVGPLNSSYQYRVHLNKPEYKFVLVSNDSSNHYQFTGYRLSQIKVHVVDIESLQSLSGILLSIIGDNYRANQLTDVNGSYSFIGLLSGKYYIRAMMKELEFYPSGAIEVDITQGSQQTISIQAKRTFFSIFGRVVSLSGDAEAQLIVEAEKHKYNDSEAGASTADMCNKYLHRNEYGTTDDSGTFRIRGLVPNCEYQLGIKDKSVGVAPTTNPTSSKSEEYYSIRTYPNVIRIVMTHADVEDVKIIAIRDILYQEISAMVWTDDKFMSSLLISVFPLDNPDNIMTVYKFSTESIYFQMTMPQILKKTTFIIRLQSSLSPSLYSNISAQEYSLTVVPNSRKSFHKHYNFHFQPTERLSVDPEVTLTASSMLLPVLIIGITLLFYKKDNISPMVSHCFFSIRNHMIYPFFKSGSSFMYSSGSSSTSTSGNNNDLGPVPAYDSRELQDLNKVVARPKPMIIPNAPKKIPFWQKARKQ